MLAIGLSGRRSLEIGTRSREVGNVCGGRQLDASLAIFHRRGSDWSSAVDSYARASILRVQAKANVQAETDGVHEVMGLAWGCPEEPLGYAWMAIVAG
jgi:hypothetical protein